MSWETADINGDGRLDLLNQVNGISFAIQNSDGTFAAAKSFATSITGSGLGYLSGADLNHDGYADIVANGNLAREVYLGNGDGTFKAAITSVNTQDEYRASYADFNNDGNVDLLYDNNNYHSLAVALGNGDGTFRYQGDFATNEYGFASAGDFDGDGILDIQRGTRAHAVFTLSSGNGDGTFKAPVLYAASVGGAGTADYSPQTTVDLNGDGALDIVNVNNTQGAIYIISGNSDATTVLPAFNLRSVTEARRALTTFSSLSTNLVANLAAYGAAQSRIQTGLNNLAQSRENSAAAASRITDVDVATESSNYLRTQVLQQASTSVLAQVSRQPELALRLLQGV